MQPCKIKWAGVNSLTTPSYAKVERNVSGTTRLTEKLVKRKLSSNIIAQHKRIAPSLACV